MKKKSLIQHKKDIIEICKLIHQKGFVSATDGNISIKVDKNKFLITPSSINKLFLKTEDLILIDNKGIVLSGKFKPSKEYLMHLKIYEVRSDIFATIHAHPPYLTSFSVLGLEIPQDILPEVVLTIGSLPIAPYATPSTIEVPNSIEALAKSNDQIILERHGSLTYSDNIFSAYNKLEKIEHYAKILFITNSMGKIEKIDNKNLEKLTLLAKKLKLRTDFK